MVGCMARGVKPGGSSSASAATAIGRRGMTRILIVDDEPRIVSFVSRALTAAGFAVDHAVDGRGGLRMASTGIYDLILLDLRLPDIDGTEVLESLSASHPDHPVVVVSARPGTDERVRCLRLGAADFISKPFALSELMARVEARLRDRKSPRGTTTPNQVGVLTIDARTRSADVGAGAVHLSEREFRVLEYLAEREGTTVTREELLADVWGYWFDPGSNLVEVIIGRLRRKLGTELIETIRHVGYRLDAR
jgi:DNA-binding response OmpR family regulator